MNLQAQVRVAVAGEVQKAKARIRNAERETLKDALAEAKALSSGSLTPRDLRAMDHPYARRHGVARIPPQVVNAVTGEFQGGWVEEPGEWAGETLTNTLSNRSQVAQFMSGTRYMLPRPILEEVKRRIRVRRAGRLKKAVGG